MGAGAGQFGEKPRLAEPRQSPNIPNPDVGARSFGDPPFVVILAALAGSTPLACMPACRYKSGSLRQSRVPFSKRQLARAALETATFEDRFDSVLSSISVPLYFTIAGYLKHLNAPGEHEKQGGEFFGEPAQDAGFILHHHQQRSNNLALEQRCLVIGSTAHVTGHSAASRDASLSFRRIRPM